MRGIARTAVLAATCDIADAPGEPVRPRAQAAWAAQPSSRRPRASSVELGMDGVDTGGDAAGSGDAPGPSFLGLTPACQAGLASR
jgi:hypothetical protein